MLSPNKIDALFGLKSVTPELIECFIRQYWQLFPTDIITIRVQSNTHPDGELYWLMSTDIVSPNDCVRVTVVRRDSIFMFRHSLARAFLIGITDLSLTSPGATSMSCPICKE
jgi:hypothetical protein